MMRLLLLWLALIAAPFLLFAQADLKKTLTTNQIDLRTLKINKEQFFQLVENEIKASPLGVDSYGQANIQMCNLTTPQGHLHDLRNEEGREIKNLSNPSCDQIVLSKVLKESFQYK